MVKSAHTAAVNADERDAVTLRLGDQLFALPVECVRDVLRGLRVTRVPLAGREVAGAMNLRGRIVTVIHLSECLGLPPAGNGVPAKETMSVVVEHEGDLYGFITDAVGEVRHFAASELEKIPPHLSGSWKEAGTGVYKQEDGLVILLDVAKLLKFKGKDE